MPELSRAERYDGAGLVSPGKYVQDLELVDCTITGSGNYTISTLGDAAISNKAGGGREYTNIDCYTLKTRDKSNYLVDYLGD